jgi:hypothetical protein
VKRALVATLSALFLASCGIPARDRNDAAGVLNVCDRADACGADGTCIDGVCYASTAVDQEFVFEIVPSKLSGVTVEPSLVRTVVPRGVRLRSRTTDVAVRVPALVDVRLDVSFSNEARSARGCTYVRTSQGKAPAHVTLISVPLDRDGNRRRGLPVHRYGDSTTDRDGYVTFRVPPGRYDLYLQPLDLGCPFPPLLVRSVEIVGGTPIPVKLGLPTALSPVVLGPFDYDFGGFEADVVDAATGLRLSTPATVGPAVDAVSEVGVIVDGHAAAPLELYVPTDLASTRPPSYFLRFSPPEGLAAPVFAQDATTLTFQGTSGMAEVDLRDFRPALVTVEGHLETDDAGSPLPGHVWLQSTPNGLRGGPTGILSAFRTEIDVPVDAGGFFSIDLPPGKYDVTAAVSDLSSYGMARSLWDIGTSPPVQAGRILPVPQRPTMTVRVLSPGGSPVADAPIELAASTPAAYPFERVLDVSSVVVRAGASVTGPDGVAQIGVDPGRFDVGVRFSGSSGFPWTVRQGIDVDGSAEIDVPARLPVEVSGRVVYVTGSTPEERETPIFGGEIRVYAAPGDPASCIADADCRSGVCSPPTAKTCAPFTEGDPAICAKPADCASSSCVQPPRSCQAPTSTTALDAFQLVGEAHFDETGAYRILLPATLFDPTSP